MGILDKINSKKAKQAVSLNLSKEELNIIPIDSIDQVIENALVQSPQEISVLDASKLNPVSETNLSDKANISH